MPVAKVVKDDGEVLFLEADGSIVGTNRRIRGAVEVNGKGTPINTYFASEFADKPENIRWKFSDGTQRVFLYENGIRLKGRYIVEKV